MLKGVVKWFSEQKGYGFIEVPEGKDIFIHFSTIKKSGLQMLFEGQTVEFDRVDGANGPEAANVVVPAPGEPTGEA